MKTIYDRARALPAGLAAIRDQFDLVAAFPPAVEAAAKAAVAHGPCGDHADRSGEVFLTLDPISSTDLDQAFRIEQSGADLILHYAIADVAAFVVPDGAIDREAWVRGETFYLPDGKVSLYPTSLCEGAASLLPDGPRPAIVFAVRIASDGTSGLDQVERALIHSRAKLGYASVTAADLPPQFFDLARRVEAAESARGAARVDPPQQQIVEADGACFALGFRPMSDIEQANAGMSLACNLAVAAALQTAHTGLFRVMPEPGQRATSRLRHTAQALGIEWPSNEPLKSREAKLDPNDPRQAAFMLAIRRAGQGASYRAFVAGETPWHSAMAATYAHATAPLRRLADRYVTEATLAIANGREVPDWVSAKFPELPVVMNRVEARASQIDSAVVELAEAVVLQSRVGESFAGRVTDIDDRGARIQLCAEPVVTRVDGAGLSLGEQVDLKLTEAVPAHRLTRFARA
ncbi:MAG: RNB domain-containing ribonuclease [Sphingomicrobium sp.]